ALILQPVVFEKEEMVAFSKRSRIFRIVVEFLKSLLDLRSVRNLIQIAEGYLVLFFDPLCSLRRIVVFKPAIGIGNIDSKICIHLIALLGFGILKPLRAYRKNGREKSKEQ